MQATQDAVGGEFGWQIQQRQQGGCIAAIQQQSLRTVGRLCYVQGEALDQGGYGLPASGDHRVRGVVGDGVYSAGMLRPHARRRAQQGLLHQ